MTYKCIDYHFCGTLVKHFHRGDSLSSESYSKLSFNEKRYFKPEEATSSSYSSSNSSDSNPSFGFDFGTPGPDPGSSLDSGSFGGGDFGGGGASGAF